MGTEQTAELSDAGYQFLIDLFNRHDKVRRSLFYCKQDYLILGCDYMSESLTKEHNAGHKVNFSVHLQRLASKIFSTSKLVRPLANSFQCLGDMGVSNSQTFGREYFSQSQLIKFACIL